LQDKLETCSKIPTNCLKRRVVPIRIARQVCRGMVYKDIATAQAQVRSRACSLCRGLITVLDVVELENSGVYLILAAHLRNRDKCRRPSCHGRA